MQVQGSTRTQPLRMRWQSRIPRRSRASAVCTPTGRAGVRRSTWAAAAGSWAALIPRLRRLVPMTLLPSGVLSFDAHVQSYQHTLDFCCEAL